MKRLIISFLIAAAAYAQPSLKGVVKDPSGAPVPGALVQLIGPGGESRATSSSEGLYATGALRAGNYRIRVIAQGFSVSEYGGISIQAPVTLDVNLVIEATRQVVNVEEEALRVDVTPGLNAGALVLGQKELATLSDDPDVLLQQLQALAGPGAGPNGGQVYIDGFTGGNLPPKASIREVRVNSNPFSAEYERPGFGRIEIFTRPGTNIIRGQAFFQFNNQNLNSRSPLLSQSTRPPYEQKFFGASVSGPLKREKASMSFDVERRNITENAFIYATTLDSNLRTQNVNEAIETPQYRTNFSPRVDYAINSKATLVGRYQFTKVDTQKEGIGDYALSSRAYNQASTESTLQLTETQILSATAISETRFQFMRSNLANTGDNTTPSINVTGAFQGGGAQIGNSGSVNNRWELSNTTSLARGVHSWRFGGRIRQVLLDSTSVQNFGGNYTFFGGQGPALDANNQPIAGTSVDLTALERYRRTLLFAGRPADEIRRLGGGAAQFTLSAGTPSTSVNQVDTGLFVNDDWRVSPTLTLSYGARYEVQTNGGGWGNLAPRFGVAWGLKGRGGVVSTVIRAGVGAFFDRISESVTLNANRFDGVTQQSYLIQNPDFYPQIPTAADLNSAQLPQSLQLVDGQIRAARNYQLSLGVERQFGRTARLSVNYIGNRGNHLQRSRNINTPVNGLYPFGDSQLRYFTESSGSSRGHQLVFSPNVNFKGLTMFGFYGLSFGKADNEGQPADPYNLRAEWGPSSFADIRHRLILGTSLPTLYGFSLNPFLMVNGGSPYNITTGRDTNGDGLANERPSLVDTTTCAGTDLVYKAGFGCFNLNPSAGTAISRNYGRGPATASLNLRLMRSWAFGSRGESGPAEQGPPPGMGGIRGGGPPGGGPGGGGPPPGGGGPGGGGPPPGLFGPASGKKYNLTFSVQAQNALNTSNFSSPSGDLSSPFFGQYRSLSGLGPLGGASTYNRKVDLQLRFTF